MDWCRPLRAWTVARYADAVALLRDPRIGANRPEFLLAQIAPEEMPQLRPLIETLAQWVVLTDPPKHTEVRSVLMRGLSPRVLEGMRPRIQKAVDELLEPVTGADTFDFVEKVALPLPAVVIADLLGVPPSERHRFRTCSRDLAELIGSAARTAAMAARAQASILEFIDYFRTLTASRRAAAEGFLDVLIAEQDMSEYFQGDRLAAHVIALLFAAHETTANLLGNMVFTLLRHPQEFARVLADRSLIPSAIEECVRFESPGHALSRTVLEEVELNGEHLKANDRLLLLVGSANRDPEQFPEPHRFDVGRAESRHMGFGYGIHFCVGAALARMETQIVLATLLERWPMMQLVDSAPPRWQQNLALRGLQHLSLRLRG